MPVPSDDPVDIRPTLAQVGALVRGRTRSDLTGLETGTFSANTQPTAAEVTDFIDQAIPEVRLQLPADLADDLEAMAKILVARRAGMLVEFDREQAGNEDSDYARLESLYDTGLAALLRVLENRGQDATTEGRLVTAQLVSPYSGPPIVDPLTAIALDQE